MRTIKLMTDYDCFPLWEILDDGLVNLDPRTLPISEKLICSLKNWTDKYDSTLDLSDPINSAFASIQDEESFNREGKLLYQCLKKELGDNFEVLKL
jgi:hypothetical protein